MKVLNLVSASILLIVIMLTRCFVDLCPEGKWPCDDLRQCIDKSNWCDDKEDCDDKSDEKYCKQKNWFDTDPNSCSRTHFLCEDGQCVPLIAYCDGKPDCKNGADEKNCSKSDISSTKKPTTSTTTTRKPTTTKSTTVKTTTKPSVFSLVTGKSVPRERKFPDENDDDDSDSEENENENDDDENEIDVFQNHGNGEKAIKKGVEWILSVRNSNYGWDSSTCRALIAIGLSQPNIFLNASKDVSLMKKQLQILIAMDMYRDRTQPVTLNRLALYINAMLATCQNPRNLYGLDLVHELRKRTTAVQKSGYRSRTFINPIVFLTLCLMDQTDRDDIYKLRETLRARAEEPRWHDMQALSIMVFACIKTFPQLGTTFVSELNNGINSLANRLKTGRVGNIYSSGLSAQALLAAGKLNSWDPQKTIQSLKRSQKKNGSFGDLLATYYVLPVIAGKSFLDLKYTPCQIPKNVTELMSVEQLQQLQGGKQYVRYSLYFGEPLTLSYSIQLRVPVNTSLFDIMRFAEYDDPKFKFLYEEEGNSINVFSIGNVPNDAERGFYWQLFTNMNTRHAESARHHNLRPITNSIKRTFPKDGDHITFWHKPIGN